MMRMALIVVSLSTLTVIELVTPSRTKTNAPDPSDQLTVDVNVTPETLEAADRIEIHNLQPEAPIQPVSPVEPTLPADVTTLVSGDSSTVGFGGNDKKGVVKKLNSKPKYTDHPNKPEPKRTNSNKAPKIERSKAIVEVKPCRPDALGSQLEALKLSSRCQT
jgi:hypothetical protein